MIDPIHIGAYAGENGVSGLCFTPRMSPAHSPMKYKMPIFFTTNGPPLSPWQPLITFPAVAYPAHTMLCLSTGTISLLATAHV